MFPSASSGDFLRALVDPWYQALQNPMEAQNQALQNLVMHYRKTEYGKQHSIDEVKSIPDFQLFLPFHAFRVFHVSRIFHKSLWELLQP